jgi:hypothetical protein
VQAGFSDQSQFCHHFRRLVGVTPGRFRTPATIAEEAASPAKKSESPPDPAPHPVLIELLLGRREQILADQFQQSILQVLM